MKPNIGILAYGDPTVRGTIPSEVIYLNKFVEENSDCNFYVITITDRGFSTLMKKDSPYYKFPYKHIKIKTHEDWAKLANLSALYVSNNCILSNFYGGVIIPSYDMIYNLISYCSNDLNIPVFARYNDSESLYKDFRRCVQIRYKRSEEKAKTGVIDNFQDKRNMKVAESIMAAKEYNYKNIYWLGNGSKDYSDWLVDAIHDRTGEELRGYDRATILKNSIYLSDDLFFLVKDNYKRFENIFKPEDKPKDQLCFIGYFNSVSGYRVVLLEKIFKSNTCEIPFKIFGKGTDNIKKLKFSNIDIEEGYVKGDSAEYFSFLHSYLAYIFIGKGKNGAKYIGKTVYDCVVARTPVLVYKPIDSDMKTFDNPEYYFSDEKELHAIYEKLKDPQVRNAWIEDQKNQIFDKLSQSKFKFSDYCEAKEEIDETTKFASAKKLF